MPLLRPHPILPDLYPFYISSISILNIFFVCLFVYCSSLQYLSRRLCVSTKSQLGLHVSTIYSTWTSCLVECQHPQDQDQCLLTLHQAFQVSFCKDFFVDLFPPLFFFVSFMPLFLLSLFVYFYLYLWVPLLYIVVSNVCIVLLITQFYCHTQV